MDYIQSPVVFHKATGFICISTFPYPQSERRKDKKPRGASTPRGRDYQIASIYKFLITFNQNLTNLKLSRWPSANVTTAT